MGLSEAIAPRKLQKHNYPIVHIYENPMETAPDSTITFQLNLLPRDLLVLVFSNLDPRSRVLVERVSRSWRELARCSWFSMTSCHWQRLFPGYQYAVAPGYHQIMHRCAKYLKTFTCLCEEGSHPLVLGSDFLDAISLNCSGLTCLQFNNVSFKPSQELDSFFINFPQLSELVLCNWSVSRGYKFSSSGCRFLKRFHSLKRLKLQPSDFRLDAFKEICMALGPTLQCLSLYTGLPAAVLADGLSLLTNLRELTIDRVRCSFSKSRDADILLAVAENCKKLQLLMLTEIDVTQIGLMTTLSELTDLRVLNLGSHVDYAPLLHLCRGSRQRHAALLRFLFVEENDCESLKQISENFFAPDPIIVQKPKNIGQFFHSFDYADIIRGFWVLNLRQALSSPSFKIET